MNSPFLDTVCFSAKALLCTNVVFWHWSRGTQYSDQGRHNDDSSSYLYQVRIPKRQSLVPEALPTSNNITPSLHILPLLLKAAPPSKTCLKAPRRRRQLQKKRKNNPPFPRKWRLTLSQYTKIYQRILFYQDSSKILHMRERLVPGPYLSHSAHRARIRAWVRGYVYP